MAFKEVFLGSLIHELEQPNTELKYSQKDVRGVSNLKEIIKTKANVSGRDFSKFSIVYQNQFFFNHRTSRNGSKFSVTINDTGKPFIVTEDYVLFEVIDPNVLLPEYLFMFLNRSEFDRYVITNSWGSSTEFFNFEDLCEIKFPLPPIETQRKYVAIYEAMLANQRAYEKGLDDLQLVRDGYIENLKRNFPLEKIGRYISQVNIKNTNPKLQIMGISNTQKFSEPNSRVENVSPYKYFTVAPGDFGYSPIHINDGSIALNTSDETYAISPIYQSFKVDKQKISGEYLT